MTASTTVTTGSHVLSNEARAAPTRGRPARNVEMAIMVGTTASDSTTSHPSVEGGMSNWPRMPAIKANAIPAPDMITALAPIAGTRLITFSLKRM